MQLSEVDVFKAAAKSPKLISFNESHKILYKVWSGFTKFIRSNINKGLNVNCEFGRFVFSESGGVIYIPSTKFISQGNFAYKNLDLFSTESRDKRLDQHISYSAIACVCGLERDQVQKCIQEIIQHAIELADQGNIINLDFKIGKMALASGKIEWMFYKQRKNLNTSLDSCSIRENSVATPRSSRCTEFRLGSLSVHPSNPNPVHQGPSKNLNNYYRGLNYKQQNAVPLPVAFYTGKIHPLFDFRTKYTRRQACDLFASPQDLLNAHNEQIKQKALKLKEIKEKTREEEVQTLKTLNDQLQKDRDDKEYSDTIKRSIFLHENMNQIEHKKAKNKKMHNMKLNETYDYFPFTHGDQVEAQQKMLKQTLKDDLKKHLGFMNSTFDAISFSPTSPSNKIELPRFLLPAEYNSKQSKTYDRDVAMESALDRYEQELIEKEKENERIAQEQANQEALDKAYINDRELKHKKKLKKYRNTLEQQMLENSKKKEMEKIEKLSPGKTSFGPEESKEDIENEMNQKVYREKENKEAIAKQMIERLEKKKNYKEENRNEDHIINQNIEKILYEEDYRNKEKIKQEKLINKNAWIKQMKLKELEKTLEGGLAGF